MRVRRSFPSPPGLQPVQRRGLIAISNPHSTGANSTTPIKRRSHRESGRGPPKRFAGEALECRSTRARPQRRQVTPSAASQPEPFPILPPRSSRASTGASPPGAARASAPVYPGCTRNRFDCSFTRPQPRALTLNPALSRTGDCSPLRHRRLVRPRSKLRGGPAETSIDVHRIGNGVGCPTEYPEVLGDATLDAGKPTSNTQLTRSIRRSVGPAGTRILRPKADAPGPVRSPSEDGGQSGRDWTPETFFISRAHPSAAQAPFPSEPGFDSR